MAMPRPGGKALKIAKATVPGLREQKDESAQRPSAVFESLDTLKMEINQNRGMLPKKYR